MQQARIKVLTLICLALGALLVCIIGSQAHQAENDGPSIIPRTWDDLELTTLELPLAETKFTPVQVSAAYYYSISVLPIYKSYPIYVPGKEPPDYLDWLAKQEPALAFDATQLKTKDDW